MLEMFPFNRSMELYNKKLNI
uniref:Uncharacterized protein n=1 Tax=Anguilla anguilla TaxID=7936 RepID=A0A0E9UTI5_ANGAN